MKLFTKYNRTNLVATIIIFLLASAAFSFLIEYVLVHQVDDNLKIEKREIKTYIEKYNALPETVHVKHEDIAFEPIDAAEGKDRFNTVKSTDQNEDEPMRQLKFSVQVKEQWYLATVRTSLQDTDDLIRSIIGITLVTILTIMVATFLINRIVLKKLWQPFYKTVDTLKDFRIGKGEYIQLPATDIDEFTLLNETLKSTTGKAEEDYIVLKEFTENASHELQTPLAVIRSKMDMLIQDEHLTEKQSEAVQVAYQHINKIARLNQSLLLLAKIENRQFGDLEQLNLETLLTDKLKQFKELLDHKKIEAETHLENVSIHMNPYLADLLLNNLFSNAIRHNIPGGKLLIDLKGHTLTISNTGQSQALDKSRLFVRFSHATSSNEHNGLGLSIIKQICEVSNCTINYDFNNGMHQFTISALAN